MVPKDAPRLVKEAATYGGIYYTKHARDEMAEGNAQRQDVIHALKTANLAKHNPPPDTKWRFENGKDNDGHDLVVVAEYLEPQWRVVTVF